jgi:hypothetical protein
VAILDASGAVLAEYPDLGCSEARAWVTTGGTYFIQVQDGGATTAPFAYDLMVSASRPGVTEQEPNGTLDQASPFHFLFGQQEAGIIQPEGDVDVWSFTAAGAPFVSYMASTWDSGNCQQTAASLEVIDGSGSVVAEAIGDLTTGNCARVSALLPPGSYGLRLRAAAGQSTFAYSLYGSLLPFTPQELEPNATAASANDYASVGGGAPVLGGIWPAGDVDVWGVTAASAVWANIRLRDASGTTCPSGAARLRILNAAGNDLTPLTSGTCGYFSVLLATGISHVEVSSASPGATFGYQLSISL